MIWFYLIIFFISCFLLFLFSKWLMNALSKIAEFLGWKEFVVAFFLIAFSVSLPNFFVGIISAIQKVPELSLGDVIGGNVVALTLLTSVAALISKNGLSAPSRTVQKSSVFMIFIAILLFVLISDGLLSRVDGIILLLIFAAYVFWLFNKKERFVKVYEGNTETLSLKMFFQNLGILITSVGFLSLSAFAVVKSSCFFAEYFNFDLGLIGILIIGLGNNLGELTFVLRAARKSQDWFVLGDIIGGIIITNTLVLGIVAIISPIVIPNFLPFVIARIFLLVGSIFFFIFLRSGHKITEKEAFYLLLLYILFLLVEFLVK